jgi:protein phosphatase
VRVKVVAWARSDVGRKREHNEDSLLADEALGLFVVADGMGGHQGGERASRMAVEVLRGRIQAIHEADGDFDAAARELVKGDPLQVGLSHEITSPLDLVARPRRASRLPDAVRWGSESVSFDQDDSPYDDLGDMPTDPNLPSVAPSAATILRAAARAAGRRIYDTAQGDPNLSGMGTTLTALLIHRDRAHLAHVGDSRAFLIRDGVAVQLTEDHSWIAEQVRAGLITEDEAKESRFRHIITRSVGFEPDVAVDLLGLAVQAGDCFLLCSDGMSNHVTAEEIGRLVVSTWYAKVPELLVELANDRGGDDNISVVLVLAANDATEG